MHNMLGDKSFIDVTDLVTKKGYRPVYCGEQKEICSLINPAPLSIENHYEVPLKNALKRFLNENKVLFDTNYINKTTIIEHSKYQYSYIITYDLVDVYKTEIILNNDTLVAYFRKDNKNLVLPFQADGWVTY